METKFLSAKGQDYEILKLLTKFHTLIASNIKKFLAIEVEISSIFRY